MDLNPALARRIVQGIAVGRIGLGVVAVAAPKFIARPWVGDPGRDHAPLLFARALGGRDVALGVGAVLAISHDEAVRGWVEGGALADLTDAAATVIYFRRLPSRSRWVVLAAAAGSAAVAGAVARRIDAGR